MLRPLTLMDVGCVASLDVYSGSFLAVNSMYHTSLRVTNSAIAVLPEYIDGRIDIGGANWTRFYAYNCSNITSSQLFNGNISLVNLGNLPNFEYLLIYGNPQLKILDFSTVPTIIDINAVGCNVVSLNISGTTALQVLRCATNNLTSLDLSYLNVDEAHKNHNTEDYPTWGWSIVECSDNQLTSLVVPIVGNNGGPQIANGQTLQCHHNLLTSLTFTYVGTGTYNLISLGCNNNTMSTLDVSKLDRLETLYCDNNKLESLDLSNNKKLTTLTCNDNLLGRSGPLLINTDLSGESGLGGPVYCGNNELTSLDVSNNIGINMLSCSNNKLETLIITNTAMYDLQCYDNQLSEASINDILVNLSMSGNTSGVANMSSSGNAAPTGYGIIARGNLTASGWVINDSSSPTSYRL